jgi:DNA-binding NarL/FixJ family response regulator
MPIARDEIWVHITSRRAELLAGVAAGKQAAQIASGMGIKVSTVRTQVAFLERLSGCGDMAELEEWWRQNRPRWIAWLRRISGETEETG